MTQYFDLNIGSEVLEHFTIEDGLREIISNALDIHQLKKINKLPEIKKSGKLYVIKDYGTGITKDAFTFDINKSKSNNNDVLGFYGFGLKDALGVFYTNNINVIIKTKRYIFKLVMRNKEGHTKETLHLEITKNTEGIEGDCGTEFILTSNKLVKRVIDAAKNKFTQYINPTYLYNTPDFKIFLKDGTQSIYVNGAEVYCDSGFKFSYYLKRTDELKQAFNRDRKQIEHKILRDKICDNLSDIELFDDGQSLYEDFNGELINILGQEKLEEFNNIKVLRNIINQFNETEQYIFIGKREKKFDKQIEEDELTKIVIGNGVTHKFKVTKVSDLHHKNKFYGSNFDKKPYIKTTMIYKEETELNEENLKNLIAKLIEDLEKKLTISTELKEKLTTIKIRDNDEDDEESCAIETDEDGDIYVFKSLIDNRLRFGGSLVSYILKNSEQDIKISDLLGEVFLGGNKKWFGLF